jgi:hypothetical protein
MNYFKNLMMTVIASLATASFVSAQDGAAMPFTLIARNPVSVGMGFSGIASVHDAEYSSFRNSSVLPFAAERFSVGVSGQVWAPHGVTSTNLAFGSAFKAGKRLGFSVGGAYQIGEEYTSIDETGNQVGIIKTDDLIISIGAGFLVIDNLSVGVNVRYAAQTLSSDNSYSAVSTDVFMAYRLSGINITAGISSLGSSIKSVSGDSFSLPTSASTGVEWSKSFSEAHSFRLLADADYYFSGNITIATGVEYSFRNLIFLRAGYHIGSDKSPLPAFASVGLGVKFKGFKLNAAYILASEALAGTLTVGLGYNF